MRSLRHNLAIFFLLLGVLGSSLVFSYTLTVSDGLGRDERSVQEGGNINADTHVATLVFAALLLGAFYRHRESLLSFSERRDVLSAGGVSLLLSGMLSYGSRLVYQGLILGGRDSLYMVPFGAWQVVVFGGSFFYLFFILRAGQLSLPAMDDWLSRPKQNFLPKGAGLFFFGVLILFWTPYLLALYPGVVTPDTITSLRQIFGQIPYQNDHPLLFTYTLSVFFSPRWDVNLGAFLFAVCQMGMAAGTLSYLLKWLLGRGIGEFPVLLFLGYFALMPVFPIYAITLQKDTLFTLALLLFSLGMFSAAEDPKGFGKKDQMLMVLLVLLVVYLRHNGIYVALITLLAGTIILWRKGELPKMILPWVGVGAAVMLLGYPLFNVKNREGAMAFSIPLQQLAKVIADQQEEARLTSGFQFTMEDSPRIRPLLPEEDLSFMAQIIPLDFYRAHYTPAVSDTIRLNDDFNQEFLRDRQSEFFQIWLRNMVPHFSSYVDAYGLSTFGFWLPKAKSHFGFLDIPCDPTYTRAGAGELGGSLFDFQRRDLFQAMTGTSLMDEILSKRNFFGSGTLLWAVLLGAFLAYSRRKELSLVLFIPGIMVFLTLLASTPVAMSLRYVLIFAYGLPVYLCAAFLRNAPEKKKEVGAS